MARKLSKNRSRVFCHFAAYAIRVNFMVWLTILLDILKNFFLSQRLQMRIKKAQRKFTIV